MLRPHDPKVMDLSMETSDEYTMAYSSAKPYMIGTYWYHEIVSRIWYRVHGCHARNWMKLKEIDEIESTYTAAWLWNCCLLRYQLGRRTLWPRWRGEGRFGQCKTNRAHNESASDAHVGCLSCLQSRPGKKPLTLAKEMSYRSYHSVDSFYL